MAEMIKDLGSGGLNTDLPPTIAPMNTFTDCLNVRFTDNAIETITGEEIFSLRTGQFGLHIRYLDGPRTVLFNKQNVTELFPDGTVVNTTLSGGTFTSSRWHGSVISGGYGIVINDGINTPLYWLNSTGYTQLPNWNYGGNTVTAGVLRPYNYVLVAGNLKMVNGATTTYAPGTIRISTQAAFGGVPQVWQPGLTTDTADEFELSTTNPVLEMAELKGQLYVYTSGSIHVVSVGQVTRAQTYSNSYGIWGLNCVTEFDGKHFVVGKNDIYIHNGSGEIQSIANYRVRRDFFDGMNRAGATNVHTVRDKEHDEIWVCYPDNPAVTTCTKALIYNYRNNTWTKRTLPQYTTGEGIMYSFNAPAIVSGAFDYYSDRIHMIDTIQPTYITNNSHTFSGTPISWYLIKKKMLPGDMSINNIISSLYLLYDNVELPGYDIVVNVEGSNTPSKNISFNDSNKWLLKPNTEGTQGYKVDPRITGRFLSYGISGNGAARLAGIGVDLQQAGKR